MAEGGFKNVKSYGDFEFAKFRDFEIENIIIVANK